MEEIIDTEKQIKSLTIITNQGVKSYSVGFGDVTKIVIDAIQISEHLLIDVFHVYKGSKIFAEVSRQCPYDIVYDIKKQSATRG